MVFYYLIIRLFDGIIARFCIAYLPYDISIIFIPIIIELIVYQIIVIFEEKKHFILLLNYRGLPIFDALYDII